MPRYARKLSKSKLYHIMLRGNEKKQIFLDEDDKKRFLDTVQGMKVNDEYEVFAFCIMDNHVHLLIKEGKDSLQRSMKRIGVSYSYYFNKKYNRVGHLFQDRYRSERIDGDAYFITVVRYIHNNPVKAGMVKNIEDYPWSSFRLYLGYDQEYDFFLNTKPLLEMFSNNVKKAIMMFIEFSNQENEDTFIDYDNEELEKKTLYKNLTEAVIAVVETYGYGTEEIRFLKDKNLRNQVIREIKDKSEGSIRELSKILGISKDIIFRV